MARINCIRIFEEFYCFIKKFQKKKIKYTNLHEDKFK